MTIKLIALDVDGTLLNSRHEMSIETVKTLKSAINKGYIVVLATGKSFYSVNSILKELNLSGPSIYLQGGYVCDLAGKVLYESHLNKSLVFELFDLLRALRLQPIVYAGDKLFVEALTRHTTALIPYHETPPIHISSLVEIAKIKPVYKIVVIDMDSEETISNLDYHVRMRLSNRVQIMSGGIKHMLEILPLEAKKENALTNIAHQFNISNSEILAIGDGKNDIGMLRMAGVSVAMANSPSKVKKVAQYISLSNDDEGVAYALKKILFSE